MVDTIYDRVNDYSAVHIRLASPNDILSWSYGEVKKPETINYRTYRPEKDGLFCERIFGPERDWECFCGKYKGIKHRGIICDRCGIKIIHSRVRRERMGHINLAAPVVHIWFFKAMPSRLGNLLAMKTSSLERIIYYQDYVVIDPGDAQLKEKQLLTEEEFRMCREKYGESFEADTGAEAIRKLIKRLDLEKLVEELKAELKTTKSKQKTKDLIKRLKIVKSILDSGNKPEWMVMDVIPVIPPDLRPLVLLESGNFATSDLNDLYRRLINRNNRLKKLLDLNAPDVIIRNEKRMLQHSVDALFDNNRCRRPVLGSNNRPLKSLTDMIKGKQGRFRENLLGKRVDYSARSVIAVGPELKIHQCGLPKKIALELYQPFIIRRLKELGHADTIKSAKKMLERKDDEVWDILEDVIHEHPVLLNRAPTLHRMGIQAFEPVLIEGNAIKIHPLVCEGFNADFDGDQMAVHLPLSIEAQVEASTLMLSTNNVFSPASGKPIIAPSQDIVLGCYYLTASVPQEEEKARTFSSPMEVFRAHAAGKVSYHSHIRVRLPGNVKFMTQNGIVREERGIYATTVGRVYFNDVLPSGMNFYNLEMSKANLNRVVHDCYQLLGRQATLNLLDDLKELGFKVATIAGLSFAKEDLRVPESKAKILAATQQEVEKVEKQYQRGVITEGERYNQIIDLWTHATEKVGEDMLSALKNDFREGKYYLNPIYMMVDSGSRGSVTQIRQLAGMRGLMAKPSGKIIETPIKASFREGLKVLEYFSSTHGARKGLADTALKTADSGYLTRKLADVAQNVVITEDDCGTLNGITKGVIYKGDKIEVALAKSITGRVARNKIVDVITDDLIVDENQIIFEETAKKIESMGYEKMRVRSPLTCESSLGVCAKCYGMDRSTGRVVEEGMAVGIIAAQSIGEPGTQLTMRTFHIGGIASKSVEETITKTKHKGSDPLQQPEDRDEPHGPDRRPQPERRGDGHRLEGRELERHAVPAGAILLVKEGDEVKAGTELLNWEAHMIPIIAEKSGKIEYDDIVEGATMKGGAGHGVEEAPPPDHRAQGRAPPADHHQGYERRSARHVPDPGEGLHRGRARPEHLGRNAHREDAAGDLGHPGHHGRSSPGHRDLRGAPAEEPRRHQRDRRARGARREEAREVDDHRPERVRDGSGPPHSAREALPRPQGRPREGGRGPRGWPARPARHPQDQRRGGRAAVPPPRGPERLPFAERDHRRQAHRDHHRPDAPERAGERLGRHRPPSGNRDRQVQVPEEQSGNGEAREEAGPCGASPPRNHEGVAPLGELHLRGELPGDHQGVDRGGARR